MRLGVSLPLPVLSCQASPVLGQLSVIEAGAGRLFLALFFSVGAQGYGVRLSKSLFRRFDRSAHRPRLNTR